jgi:hypothetical protein
MYRESIFDEDQAYQNQKYQSERSHKMFSLLEIKRDE